MSSGSDDSGSGSEARSSGKEDENQAAIKAALDSLKGIRAYSATSHSFDSARKEVNAGLRGSSSKALAIVSAMQKKKTRGTQKVSTRLITRHVSYADDLPYLKDNKGKGTKRKHESSNTKFEVKAIVLYPDVTIGDPDEVVSRLVSVEC